MDKRYCDSIDMPITVQDPIGSRTTNGVAPNSLVQSTAVPATRKASLLRTTVQFFLRLPYSIARPIVKPFIERIHRYFAYTPQLLWTLDETIATKRLVIEALAQNCSILAKLAELEVAAGARRLIEANPELTLIVELGPSQLTRTGRSVSDWLQQFADPGLRYRVIFEPLTGRLEHHRVSDLEAVESANLLFARPEAAVWQKAELP